MPNTDELIPFLRRIDSSGIYSNNGPLCQEFTKVLEKHFNGYVCLTTSGTTALQTNLTKINKKGICILPSWTFTASVAAVKQAGLTPFFVDIDPITWTITPYIASRAIEDYKLENVVAIMPVSAYGAPLNASVWQKFSEQNNIPVIIDAAAGFANFKASKVPTMISLHATKIFGTGECGVTISTDKSYIDDLRSQVNFGFKNSRESKIIGTNSKISEYTATVGLAMWKKWSYAKTIYKNLAIKYQEYLANNDFATMQPGFGYDWLSMHANIFIQEPVGNRLIEFLKNNNIDTRIWWGEGCHEQNAYKKIHCSDLTVTNKLARSVIGLPFHKDLTEENIAYITSKVSEFFTKKHQTQKSLLASHL